ncbi:hypothetical protein FCM35_KLT11614 [Carex littledalei]|uniref:Uncharacterized protein n=1 Tax=Carex littledalei TaxID=544730 RepID=A0A833V4X6_9POAL|nr:hypothetical protein FCM35_KLT11614 [Carex littledalei]
MGVSGAREDKGTEAGGVEARYEKGCGGVVTAGACWVWRREDEERERRERGKSPHLFVRLPLRCNNSSGGDLIARK